VVYLQGQRMGLTGTRRRFVTPELSPQVTNSYSVKVELQSGGRLLSKTLETRVVPGQQVEITVSFDQQNPGDLVASVAPARGR
jgi:uncharacterized protein (TIGR03000 family)